MPTLGFLVRPEIPLESVVWRGAGSFARYRPAIYDSPLLIKLTYRGRLLSAQRDYKSGVSYMFSHAEEKFPTRYTSWRPDSRDTIQVTARAVQVHTLGEGEGKAMHARCNSYLQPKVALGEQTVCDVEVRRYPNPTQREVSLHLQTSAPQAGKVDTYVAANIPGSLLVGLPESSLINALACRSSAPCDLHERTLGT